MHVALRVDGGKTIGMGHLVRQSTLGTALRNRGHDVTLLTMTPEAAEAVVPTGRRVRTDIDAALGTDDVDALVVDLPADSRSDDVELGSLAMYERLEDRVGTLVVFEDYVDRTIHADLLVNGHVYAGRDGYDWTGAEPAWLLGGDYVVLDESIRAFAEREPPWRDPPERCIVAMGGSDVANLTPTAMRAFDDSGLAVDVIIGPGFDDANRKRIERTATAVDTRVTLHEDPDDLASLMFDADAAVSALGLMTYEFLALGTPIVGAVTAPDQQPKAGALRDRNAAVVIDDTDVATFQNALDELRCDTNLRREIRNRGRTLVDPDGVDRIIDAIEEIAT